MTHWQECGRCPAGGRGFRVDEPEQLEPVLAEALALSEKSGPAEIRT